MSPSCLSSGTPLGSETFHFSPFPLTPLGVPYREAQVGAPDLDLAILSGLEIRRVSCTGLQLRRRTAGEWRDCPDKSGQSGQSTTNQGNQSASFAFKVVRKYSLEAYHKHLMYFGV